jgi:hypothetical protein
MKDGGLVLVSVTCQPGVYVMVQTMLTKILLAAEPHSALELSLLSCVTFLLMDLCSPPLNT